MGGWVGHMLTTGLPQPLLRYSSIWHTVIKPVVHHNIMLRNRVRQSLHSPHVLFCNKLCNTASFLLPNPLVLFRLDGCPHISSQQQHY